MYTNAHCSAHVGYFLSPNTLKWLIKCVIKQESLIAYIKWCQWASSCHRLQLSSRC